MQLEETGKGFMNGKFSKRMNNKSIYFEKEYH